MPVLSAPRAAAAALWLLAGGLTAYADDTAYSAADKAFVLKVSQGGMFEVAAGKLASSKGREQNVVDLGTTEAHDHQLVGDKLSAIASKLDITTPPDLDASFQGKIDHLSSLSGAQFDNAFIADMVSVHAADGAAFAKEARLGKNPMLRDFAAETVLIVRRHQGALKALPAE